MERIKSAADTSNSADNSRPPATDELARDAEAELNAFQVAVRRCWGASSAELAVDLWIRIFSAAEISNNTLREDLREITIRSSAILAAHIVDQNRGMRKFRATQDAGHESECSAKPC